MMLQRVPVPHDEEGYAASFTLNQEPEILQFFQEYGFVVVRDVLTPEDCKNTLDDIFGILEADRKFKRNDVFTWSNWPENSIERYGSPHKPPIFAKQFLRNRQNPNVYRVFSLLLEEENLLVNHDRCCFFRPTTSGVVGLTGQMLPKDMPQWTTAQNLHIDMNPQDWLGDGFLNRQSLSNLKYERLADFIFENNQPSHADGIQLQGVLNLYDNKDENGGYQCVPGFHKHFDAYFQSKKRQDSQSYNFQANEIPYKHGVRISMRAGSIVVWDQRMAHGSQPNRSSGFRSAQFIKMFPRATVDPKRARNRAATMKQQIAYSKFDTEVTELGRMLFGLNDN